MKCFAVAHLAIVLALTFVCDGVAFAQQPPRRQSVSALRELTRQLVAEAQQAMREGAMEHRQPNAAERFDDPIGESDLQRAIVERQHREPFIDAYIRWQLTSFDVDLPEMSPQEFAQFVESAPVMIENPRGDSRVIAMFSRAADAGPLSPSDMAQLREVNRTLDRQTEIAEAMNVPAVEFREWVAAKLGGEGRGPRRLLWMLENCAAAINAAWPPANYKRTITQSFSASESDASITDQDRHDLAQQAGRLAGLKREFINQVTFMADGSVRVTMSTAAVTNRDVENWTRRLAGEL